MPPPPKQKPIPGQTPIARNKRSAFDYDLTDRFEAGLVLKGTEVKMMRIGRVDLTDAFCTIERNEAYLRGMTIPHLTGSVFAHAPGGPRKLLLHRREIEIIAQSVAREGMTAVATRLYFKGSRIKIEIALARGKKIYDKREILKEQEAARETRAAMSPRRS